jgi:hypothetical protein
MTGPQFLTQQSGELPADLVNIPATETGQYAKSAVDRATRGQLVKVVNLDASKGGAYVTDTSTYVGDFKAIKAHEAAVVAVVSANMSGDLSAVVIPAGDTWFCECQSVTPASGKITIYAK